MWDNYQNIGEKQGGKTLLTTGELRIINDF